ncbi:hypothetical protein ACFQZI_10350 [Mucilaginibacter lutimaris]|uniref:Uncharacterized protein n=1 Tax=Mucilaginibacter lutimaris TaxID=931629 RepID=A0ABW2ZGF5_9SPHI
MYIPEIVLVLLLLFLKMFEDYKRLVLDFYKQKKADDGLSMNLEHPTRAKLRDECLEVLRTRYLLKDRRTIEATFGKIDDLTAYAMHIKRDGAEILRSFDYFIKDLHRNTDIKNVELLAWLIDFEPRPYQFERQYIVETPEQQADEVHETGTPLSTGNDVIEVPPPKQPKSKQKYFTVAGAAILFVLILYAGYFSISFTRADPPLTGKEKCMVWEDDHYQPVPCELQMENRQAVALDTQQVLHFKKIMKPDTVTGYSVGKLWYFKTGGKLEVFTAPGMHPIHTDRRLRPLTDYMRINYLKQN